MQRRSRERVHLAGTAKQDGESHPDSQSRVRAVVKFAFFMVVYAVARHYALAFGYLTTSPFWFPDAVLAATLLVTPPRRWWLFILGTVPIQLAMPFGLPRPAWYLVTMFAIDSAHGIVLASLLRTIRPGFRRIESVRDFMLYGLLAVILVPAATASIASAVQMTMGYPYRWSWERGFLGDGLTQLIVTPILLHWFLQPKWRTLMPRSSQQWVEAALLSVGIVATAYLAFKAHTASPNLADPRLYAPIPFLFWAAVRFGMIGATGGIGVLTLFAVPAALAEHRPFAAGSLAEAAMVLQQYLALRAAPLYLVAVVTEQWRRAESALRESERRFRTMADTAPVMIWTSGIDMLCDFFNQPWLDFTGRTVEQERGNGWAEGVHQDDLHTCLNVYQTAFAEQSPFTMQYRLRRHDGEYRWVLDSGVPRYTPTGKFEGYIGSAIDITDRYRQETALRESEERYREVVESQTDLVCRYLPDTTLTFVNDAYCRFLERDRASLLGTSFLNWLPEASRQRVRVEIGAVAAYGQRREIEHEVMLPDGRVAWQHWTHYAILGDTGHVEELQAIGHDVTDRKRLEETQRELAHASRLAIVGELTAIVAHELRQPLTAIMSNAEAARRFLRRPEPPLDEVRDILTDICESDQRASEAIVRLRALVNRRELQMQSVDMNETASIVLRLVDGDAKWRRATVRSELAPSLPRVYADPVHIQQVLLNLVINGLDATEHARDSHRELTVRTMPHGDNAVEVEVADNGPGIPVEKLPHVFQAFFTTKRDGMGIGLAIARSIIEAHGGSIWAKNNSGGGASFHFVLPTAPPSRPIASAPAPWSTADDRPSASAPMAWSTAGDGTTIGSTLTPHGLPTF